MNIKPLNREPRPVDIREWNDETKAFLRPLNGFERLVFNDYFFAFYNRDNAPEVRFDAAFKAALMALVDENGAPLLVEEDRAVVEQASFAPLIRAFNIGLDLENNEGEVETAKKN